MHFEDLWLLWILGPIFLIWSFATVISVMYRKRSAVHFSQVQRTRKLPVPYRIHLRKIVVLFRILIIALLILGMARPQTGRKHTKVKTEGIDIILVLDTSGSMQALDMEPDVSIQHRANRLEAAKRVVEMFVKNRENDQIGLVVFGLDAYTQCPLTLDHGVLTTLLKRAEIGMAGDSTAIGSAIGTAVKRLTKSKAKSKLILLLTDGRNNSGTLNPRKAAEVASTFGIKIYTIGVGTRGKAPFIVDRGFFGKQIDYQDVDLDEDTLKEVARLTGGEYYRAEDAESLQKIYETIDKLEKTEIEVKTYLEYDEKFGFFVFPALGLLLLELVLLGTRLRKIP